MIFKTASFDGIEYSEAIDIYLSVKNIENLKPSVSILSPSLNSSVEGITTIQGIATDQEGSIVKVEMSINGGVWFPVQGFENWMFEINTQIYSNGELLIRVRSFDGLDYSIEDQILMTVNNNLESDNPENWYEEVKFQWIMSAMIIITTAGIVIHSSRKSQMEEFEDWDDVNE